MSLLLIVCSLLLGFAPPNYPKIQKSGKTIESFVPKRWKIIQQEDGDLNKDGVKDAAIVIESEDTFTRIDTIYPVGTMNYGYDSTWKSTKPDTMFLEAPLRVLFVLLRQQDNSWQCSVQSNHVIPLSDEGGVEGDPFENGLTIKNGSLFINSHSGGGRFKGDETLQFRYQDSGWCLIGVKDNAFDYALRYSRFSSINLITGDAEFTFVNNNRRKDSKTERKNIGKHSLVRLQNYIEDPDFVTKAIEYSKALQWDRQ